MAYTKKSEVTEIENETGNVVKASSKEESVSDARIKALEAQIEVLTKMLASQKFEQAQTIVQVPKEEEIVVIHLLQCFEGLKTHIQLTNRTIDFETIGETRTLNRGEAEELASKYRKFFERGVLAFKDDCAGFAARFGLESFVSNGNVNRDFVNYFASLSVYDLEKLYISLGEAQKAFIIETFKRKVREGDKRFADASKIQLLERLSTVQGEMNGAMEGTLLDMKMAQSAK